LCHGTDTPYFIPDVATVCGLPEVARYAFRKLAVEEEKASRLFFDGKGTVVATPSGLHRLLFGSSKRLPLVLSVDEHVVRNVLFAYRTVRSGSVFLN